MYGFKEEERAQVKEQHWEQVSVTIENVPEILILVGNLNGMVEIKNEGSGRQ